MKPQDIDAGLSLCRAAHWNQLRQDWEICLRLSPADCRVAVSKEKIVGTVTTVRYQHFFSWIGMVLVDSSNRRQGIGNLLLQEALRVLRKEGTVKLDATPAGRKLYLKLDFEEECQIFRMCNQSVMHIEEIPNARALQKDELATLAAFDSKIFGADRQQLLRWIYEVAPEFAFVIEEGNEIQGYCLGRHGYHFEQIGPIVANNKRIARDLVLAALKNCVVRPAIIDVLQDKPEWIAWLKEIGFAEQRSFIRMYKGKTSFHGMPQNQYAIAGPEFG
jgi:predicted GNAT family N-acyltransferase